MSDYEQLKKQLLKLNTDFINTFDNADTFSGISKEHFVNYEKACESISKQLEEDIVRIAVVGPIKSGKSTFVNSLFENDYLKRGAGVITSIVTKIRCGKDLKATVSFKSWDEINNDIEQGLTLLPIENSETEQSSFDLRKETHRTKLQDALASLDSEQLIIEDSRNLNTVLLSSYLKGYDLVKDIIQPDSTIKVYKNKNFAEHRLFTGDEIMAVYINDIQLEIDSGAWNDSIEIADCQGSDSPNPLHLAMVQDYLTLTNFIVYVVSSRTGLRRADIKFLSMIKEMGIMDNMLFVINCDFSEHESLEEFNKLMKKISEELSLVIPNPEIFTLSALFNLFIYRNSSDSENIVPLSMKDKARLEQWENEKDFSDLTTKENTRFKEVLNEKLTQKRYSLLLTNHIERLALMASGISQRASVNKEIINRDSSDAKEIMNRIKGNQDKTHKVSAMIKSTLDGAIKKVNAELKREVEIYFDERSGTAITDIKKFIRNYEYHFDKPLPDSDSLNFAGNLYNVFQEFKQSVDTYMTETITPKIIGFINNNENKLVESLYDMTGPYANMVENALAEYSGTLKDFEISIDIPENNIQKEFPDIESIKKAGQIQYPKPTAIINYSARVRAESIIKFGFYNIVSFIKKIFKKDSDEKAHNEVMALKAGLSRIKTETAENLVSHFISYKENLKFQYLFKLTNGVADSIYEIHTNSFNAYLSDLETVSNLINEKKTDKENIIQKLEIFEKNIENIRVQIGEIKNGIKSM